MTELLVQPRGKDFVEQPIGLGVGQHGKCRIDARLDRGRHHGSEGLGRRLKPAASDLATRTTNESRFSGLNAGSHRSTLS